MKILIIGGYLNGCGGDTHVIYETARHLAMTDEVHIFHYLPVFHKAFERNDGVRIMGRALCLDDLKYSVGNAINWLKVIFPYLRKFSVRGWAYYFVTLLSRALIERQIETIRPDIIHIHGLSIDAFPFIEASMNSGIPFVVTAHGTYSFDQSIPLLFDKKLEKELLLRMAEHRVPITVVSSATRDVFVENFSIPPNTITVMFSAGVDFGKFDYQSVSKNKLRDLNHIPRDKIVLLQVGTLSKRKNHIAVLQAIDSMEEPLKERLFFLIVGDGKEKGDLVKFVRKNRLGSQVLFTGRLPSDKLRDMYSVSDFLILPSTSEGLPLVFVEAMAAGLPIITFSDLGGVQDIYRSYCMELVTKRTTEAVVESIRRAIERSWDRQQIMDYAREWDWKFVCERYKDCYHKAILSQHLRAPERTQETVSHPRT